MCGSHVPRFHTAAPPTPLHCREERFRRERGSVHTRRGTCIMVHLSQASLQFAPPPFLRQHHRRVACLKPIGTWLAILLHGKGQRVNHGVLSDCPSHTAQSHHRDGLTHRIANPQSRASRALRQPVPPNVLRTARYNLQVRQPRQV